MRRTMFIGILTLAALPAAADRVVLFNGQVFDGVARENGSLVEIRVEWGTVSFPRSDIRSIERSVTPLERYEQQFAALAPDDADGFYRLGLWARAQGLDTKAREALQQALAVRPDHEGAHQALGHVRQEGRWTTVEEVLQAKGYRRYEGAWRSPDEIAALLEVRRREREEDEARATADRDREIAEAARAREARERAEAEARSRAETWDLGSGGVFLYADGPTYASPAYVAPMAPVYTVMYSVNGVTRSTVSLSPKLHPQGSDDPGWGYVPGFPTRRQVAQGHGGWTTEGMPDETCTIPPRLVTHHR